MKKVITFEWHSQDMRVKPIADDICPTVSAAMGMGANMNTPILIVEVINADRCFPDRNDVEI